MIDKFKGEYRWLSNFWPARVRLDGVEFPTVEHAYQAGKVLDPEIREKIRCLPSAGDAKRFGKRFGKSVPFRPAWNDEFKISLMRNMLESRFARRSPTRHSLLTRGLLLPENPLAVHRTVRTSFSGMSFRSCHSGSTGYQRQSGM